MSTRSIIARVGKHEGEFSGVYVHSDGMPTSMGPLLFQIIGEEFKGDLKAALRFLINEHLASWSSPFPENRSCYCHPQNSNRPEEFRQRKPEPTQKFTHKNVKDSGARWLYIFDERNMRLYVRDVSHDSEHIVELAAAEQPTWQDIECGEHFERCGHYAWYHKLLPRTSNLSTQTWLERQPLDFHDAIAFVINGKRYKATGSGGSSEFYMTPLARRHGYTKAFPRHTWVADVIATNGQRMQFPVASISPEGKYTPYPGVIWIYPPTKNNPNETEAQS